MVKLPLEIGKIAFIPIQILFREEMMKLLIGICCDLKVDYLKLGFSTTEVMEFDDEETIVGIEKALTDLGHQVERIGNGRELARRLANGDRWDLVFNIAEGIKGRSREAQVPAVCELFNQPYTFSDPLTCALTLDKALAKRVVRDRGLPTAPFIVIDHINQIENVDLPMPLFCKPIAEGSSKGITARSMVTAKSDLLEIYQTLCSQVQQPMLIEPFLSGQEVTVGILGNGENTKVVGVMEIIFNDRAETKAYTTVNKKEYVERIDYRLLSHAELLNTQAEKLALDVYHIFGCRDAARVDLRCDASGILQFLEINPLPGLDHIYSDLPIMGRLLGIKYIEIINIIVSAAWERYQ